MSFNGLQTFRDRKTKRGKHWDALNIFPAIRTSHPPPSLERDFCFECIPNPTKKVKKKC